MRILASLALALSFFGPVIAQDAPRISGFHAYLFNSETGLLSGDMLAKGAPEMGNVPSGEFASVSTFIVVKVEFGKQAPVLHKTQVRLLATESGSLPFAARRVRGVKRIILDSTSSLGPVNADGGTYVGFWLPKTGCQTITLKASLVGLKKPVSSTAMLPFACYE